MKLLSYIQPARTFVPCSGVGRHINGTLGELAKGIDLELWFAREWLGPDGKLPESCPLSDLPFRTFAGRERLRERLWKLTGLPGMDGQVPRSADWVYCPMETRLPLRRTPWAFTLHDVQPFETNLPWVDAPGQRRNRRMWAMWLPKALREARLVFTVSEFSKRRMVELLGVPEGKIVVSGNGVDEGYFGEISDGAAANVIRDRLAVGPYLLMVGGLRREKGGMESLEVARCLRRVLPDLEFVVAGVPNDPSLVAMAEEIGNIRFLGKVSDQELPGLYRSAVCLLFLSLYEGFGMPPLEAMACGAPVICSNLASLPEVVGNAAYVVEPDATGQIVDWIGEIVRHPDAASGMIAKGRARAAGFTWQRVAGRVKDALETH